VCTLACSRTLSIRCSTHNVATIYALSFSNFRPLPRQRRSTSRNGQYGRKNIIPQVMARVQSQTEVVATIAGLLGTDHIPNVHSALGRKQDTTGCNRQPAALPRAAKPKRWSAIVALLATAIESGIKAVRARPWEQFRHGPRRLSALGFAVYIHPWKAVRNRPFTTVWSE
jgi:hypothetical protein